MGAVWFVVRAELRHRWRSWLSLALLVAVVGGLVLAAAAAGRRTAYAFPSFAAKYGFDSFVYAEPAHPQAAKLPEVASVVQMRMPDNGIPMCACTHQLNVTDFAVYEVTPSSMTPLRQARRRALARSVRPRSSAGVVQPRKGLGVHVGTVLHVPFFTAAQAQADIPPRNPVAPRSPCEWWESKPTKSDFPSVGSPIRGHHDHGPSTGRSTPLRAVHALRRAPAPRLGRPAPLRHRRPGLGVVGTGSQEATATITNAIHPQAVGWWLLAALAGLAGLARWPRP